VFLLARVVFFDRAQGCCAIQHRIDCRHDARAARDAHHSPAEASTDHQLHKPSYVAPPAHDHPAGDYSDDKRSPATPHDV
jgi:hypothetical protein